MIEAKRETEDTMGDLEVFAKNTSYSLILLSLDFVYLSGFFW